MRKSEKFYGYISRGSYFFTKNEREIKNMSKELKLPREDLSDERIVDLYWERDEDAIKATDEKYGKYLFAISYNILRDRLDCEECMNDTYLTTWNKIPPAKPNFLQRFLSKITRNISVDKYRADRAQKRIPSELTVSLEEIEECIEGIALENETEAVSKISEVLNAYLRALSSRERFIFVCRYYYADPVLTIAKLLEISDKTVYRELARMREELRGALSKEGIVI